MTSSLRSRQAIVSQWHLYQVRLAVAGLIYFVLFYAFSATAQTGSLQTSITSVVHPAPNAASLGKFIDMPVSLYTGLPSVAVPLWEIKQGNAQVAVSLSYHSGGVKVDEVASWVGMGWALNAGGVITRSARGLPDVPPVYRDYVLPRVHRFLQHTLADSLNFLINVYKGIEDSEPDVFTISVGGVSGRFFMGDDGNFIVAPRESNLRIAYDVTEASGQHYAWVITDGRGTQYKFNEAEYNTTTSFAYSDGKGSDGGYSGGDISSWYLTDLVDVEGNQVHFSYAREGSSFVNKASEYVNVPFVGSECSLSKGFQLVYSDISTVRLQAITCGREEIDFLPDATPRQDQSNSYGLAAIQVKYDGITKKVFRFFKSYAMNEAVGTSSNRFFTTPDYSRLRLDSLREEAKDNSEVLPAYRFTYNSRSLPYRNSLAQDYWGYYNGQDNDIGVTYYDQLKYRKGANKEPQADFASAGLLTSVHYPTGGSVDFTYEPNYYRNTFAPTVINTSLMGCTGVNRTDSLLTRIERRFEITPEMVATTLEGGDRVGYATILASTQISPAGPANGYTIDLRIQNTDTGPAVNLGLAGQQTLFLRAGTYVLLGEITTEFITDATNGTVAPTVEFTALLGVRVTYPVGMDRPGPGLRLKQLTKHFGQAVTEVRNYEYQDSTGSHSSGLLGNLPDYHGLSGTVNLQTGGDRCTFDTYQTVSHYPLINSAASYIGYSRVVEYYDAQKESGRKVYTYTNFDGFNDLIHGTGNKPDDISLPAQFPYPPASSQEWKRGLPLAEEVYASQAVSTAASNASPYRLQQRTLYTYGILPNSFVQATGLKVGTQTSFVGGTLYPLHLYSVLSFPTYFVLSDSYQLLTRSTTFYNQDQAFTTTETREYTPVYFQPQTVTSTTSDGSFTSHHLYYPTDYTANQEASSLLRGLLTANMVNLPVEEVTGRGTTTSYRAVAGSLHVYNSWQEADGTPHYYEQRQYGLNTTLADLTQRYDFLRIPAHYYEQFRITGINSHSQPISYRRLGQETTSYQWCFNDRYPAATCKNATPAEFYSEGFEENASAQLGSAHSGNRYVTGNYTVNWIRPNARAYVISYWYRQASHWYYQQQDYTGSSLLLVGGEAYDDIRICPRDAQLTTYTYDPLVGLTSQTGPDGRTLTYEYDGLGRLIRTRDEQGRILSQQQYHYAGQ